MPEASNGMTPTREWSTRSLQDAILSPPAVPVGGPLPRLPFSLWLQAQDLEGHELASSFGRVDPGATATWLGDPSAGQALYEAIVDHDMTLAGEAGGTARRDALLGLQGELTQAIEDGLAARVGNLLIGPARARSDLNTYLQLAARAVDGVHRWHVCERCGSVYKLCRLIWLPVYRCKACQGQRVPPARAAHPYRECWGCGCLFEPNDRQQTTCPECQRTKSTRSRHPERPRTPTSARRRFRVAINVEPDDANETDRSASLPASDDWTVHSWADDAQ